jgi:hypothetical protein
MSAPAKTVARLSGRFWCLSARAMPGLALPAAQPHTELTTIMVTPGSFITSSTSAAVRHSRAPRTVSSSRMGATRNSGYAIE